MHSSVFSHAFTCIVHAFICFRIDYCNSLLHVVGLRKVRRSPLQSVVNAAARSIVRLPRTPNLFFYVWPLSLAPLITQIQLNRSYNWPRFQISECPVPPAISLRPSNSLDRHDLFDQLARNLMAKTQIFPFISPSLWTQLPSFGTLLFINCWAKCHVWNLVTGKNLRCTTVHGPEHNCWHWSTI